MIRFSTLITWWIEYRSVTRDEWRVSERDTRWVRSIGAWQVISGEYRRVIKRELPTVHINRIVWHMTMTTLPLFNIFRLHIVLRASRPYRLQTNAAGCMIWIPLPRYLHKSPFTFAKYNIYYIGPLQAHICIYTWLNVYKLTAEILLSWIY